MIPSDEANRDDSIDQVQLTAGKESRSPSRSVHTNTRKRRIEGGSSSDRRRLRQEFVDLSVRDAQIQNALNVLRLRNEARVQAQTSTYQQVLTKLRQHPRVAATGPDFIFNVMEMHDEEEHSIDTLILHTLTGSSSQHAPSSQLRLPRMIGRESGARFIHRVLYGNRLDFYHQLLRLDRDAFIHLVNLMIEKQLLDEGHYLKVAEIVAIGLYILTREASYCDVQIQFPHSPSSISKYHNQVL
ncbi:hypothetical protein Cgig2_002073 [Carnegiea gigantea]|uniref:FHA domain-containing protein n=1 Tax=Carnegiea gigantea TaxID=171969 RepID=A0A9Q1JUW4_9CARY|nr:hypothetical protein Cgig2_002073 [Carnegiea gigantea]